MIKVPGIELLSSARSTACRAAGTCDIEFTQASEDSRQRDPDRSKVSTGPSTPVKARALSSRSNMGAASLALKQVEQPAGGETDVALRIERYRDVAQIGGPVYHRRGQRHRSGRVDSSLRDLRHR